MINTTKFYSLLFLLLASHPTIQCMEQQQKAVPQRSPQLSPRASSKEQKTVPQLSPRGSAQEQIQAPQLSPRASGQEQQKSTSPQLSPRSSKTELPPSAQRSPQLSPQLSPRSSRSEPLIGRSRASTGVAQAAISPRGSQDKAYSVQRLSPRSRTATSGVSQQEAVLLEPGQQSSPPAAMSSSSSSSRDSFDVFPDETSLYDLVKQDEKDTIDLARRSMLLRRKEKQHNTQMNRSASPTKELQEIFDPKTEQSLLTEMQTKTNAVDYLMEVAKKGAAHEKALASLYLAAIHFKGMYGITANRDEALEHIKQALRSAKDDRLKYQAKYFLFKILQHYKEGTKILQELLIELKTYEEHLQKEQRADVWASLGSFYIYSVPRFAATYFGMVITLYSYHVMPQQALRQAQYGLALLAESAQPESVQSYNRALFYWRLLSDQDEDIKIQAIALKKIKQLEEVRRLLLERASKK